MKIYILQAQDKRILNKDLEWSSEANLNGIFNTPHRDIALNQLIELNAKDIDLRATLVECESDAKGRPVLCSRLEASNSEPGKLDQPSAA